METTYTWHDTPTGGTHMTLRNRGEPSGFANLAAPLMSAQMRRSTTRDLKLLKSLMETRQSAQPRWSMLTSSVGRSKRVN